MKLTYNDATYNVQTRNHSDVARFCEMTGLAAFEEMSGNRNVVFYRPDQYKVLLINNKKYLVYTDYSETPEQPLNISSIAYMFSDCQSHELHLNKWRTKNISDMSHVFAGQLRSVNIDKWEFTSCTTLEGFFENAKYLVHMDLSKHYLPNVTTVKDMFLDCIALESVNVSFKAPKLKDVTSMFSGCISLRSVIANDLCTDNVDSLDYMFNDCEALTDLQMLRWSNKKFTSLKGMFKNCANIVYVPVADFSMENFVEDSTVDTFKGCKAILATIKKPTTKEYYKLRDWVYRSNIYCSCDLDSYINVLYPVYVKNGHNKSLDDLKEEFPDTFELAKFLNTNV